MSADRDRDDLDAARAEEYALLSVLLSRAPDGELLSNLGQLRGDRTPLGNAHTQLAIAARSTDAEEIRREFSDLFIGLGRGELLPYGSYYLSGFLPERPLIRLRQDLTSLGIERAPEQRETEDHIAVLCEIMVQLIQNATRDAERAFFEAHFQPWAIRFFKDLEAAKSAKFYRQVGLLGRLYVEIESEAFPLPA